MANQPTPEPTPEPVCVWSTDTVGRLVHAAAVLARQPHRTIHTDDPVLARELFWWHLEHNPVLTTPAGRVGTVGRVFTIPEAAAALGVTEMTVRNRIMRGRLTGFTNAKGALRCEL